MYTVERINDGRSFTARRVVAVQHGQPIFALSASFQRYEEGLDHQAPMPAAPDPETLPTAEQRLPAYGLDPAVVEKMLEARAAVDLRYVDDPPYGRYGEPREPHSQVWFRANGKLDDDPLLHVVLATYVSDMTLLDSVLLAHGRGGWAVGDVVGGLARPRHVVPPAVPRRRVAPVRPGVAVRVGRPRPRPGPDLHAGRAARDLGDPGGRRTGAEGYTSLSPACSSRYADIGS